MEVTNNNIKVIRNVDDALWQELVDSVKGLDDIRLDITDVNITLEKIIIPEEVRAGLSFVKCVNQRKAQI
ncbi:hypothetical protein [Shewanella fodinae]|uniref:hypothetical protein n=1 Tax=Shewanella fodinae TaxID=552357 RepID=UPI00167BECC1|nr:hypothetical protein [Shewanella fodinae]MCL2906167.1 hypothetical protein [Shewanella fodinae]GGY98865.1 hypothetical protein GCM10007169_14840 [Shewanella fodinae]